MKAQWEIYTVVGLYSGIVTCCNVAACVRVLLLLDGLTFCRDHLIQKLLPLVANTPVTAQMYEENSFLRNYSHINYLVHILGTLEEFQVTLESSLLRGLDI